MLGDGELAEGSNWEAALTASHHRLDNLIAIVDYNTLQLTGPTREVCNTESLDEKFRSFGWSVQHVEGHDYEALLATLNAVPIESGKPTAIIAHTTKGKGISFMEGVAKWHHGVPTDEEYEAAMGELEAIAAD